MITNPPTLMEILCPRCFATNPKRIEATRTIQQLDIDAFEQAQAEHGFHKPAIRALEGESSVRGNSGMSARRKTLRADCASSRVSRRMAASTQL
ncbi:MAG: hypothetical protein NT159_12805 [Proteobacteria bacterium]|nr:hypothetical protein [Pseudomonadota bacterium]